MAGREQNPGEGGDACSKSGGIEIGAPWALPLANRPEPDASRVLWKRSDTLESRPPPVNPDNSPREQ